VSVVCVLVCTLKKEPQTISKTSLRDDAKRGIRYALLISPNTWWTCVQKPSLAKMQRPNTVGREITMQTADGQRDSSTAIPISILRRRGRSNLRGPYMCDSMRLTDFRSVASWLLYDLVAIVFANLCWIETGSMSTIEREMAVARIAIS
jgi:hypothetical protein